MKRGNATRRSALTRAERAAQARRRRALSHLERVQGRKQPPPSGPDLRRLALPAFALAATVGLWIGNVALRPGPLAVLAVRGAETLSAEEIAQAAGLARGVELGELDRESVEQQLTSHAWIATARTLALPGGRLVVSVVERRAAAVLAGPEPWAVDAEGVPFAPAAEASHSELPRLTTAEAPTHGEAHPELAAAVALTRALETHGLPAPREVSVAAADDPEGFALRLQSLAPRVILGRERIDERLAALRRLLDAELPEVRQASRIDLRFEGQAVLGVPPSQEGSAQAAAAHGRAAASTRRPTG
ncbi:MAG: cell division protein FtsQ/DivIB [Deltaproteobacteria bacterium]|nr:cell division protein FtsQ/DivIB [Deltaproteobacteria bacterium]MBW2360141.1 cell division protein FtsQ/DivIB [Deltaproteobacteria bacterium]